MGPYCCCYRSKDLSQLIFHELMAFLETHELRMNRFANEEVEQAFESKVSFHGEELQKDNWRKQRNEFGRGNFKEANIKSKGARKFSQKVCLP